MELREELVDFMHREIFPAEATYQQERVDEPFGPTPTTERLKAEARKLGLWNLFLPDDEWGAGLTNVEYAPLAEEMGLTDKSQRPYFRPGNMAAYRDYPMQFLRAQDMPFQPEPGASLRALLRRRAGRADPLVTHGDLVINPATREASLAGKPLTLSAREFALLEALLDRPGAILSKTQLEERIYGWGEEIESNTVEVYVHSLRKKLGTGFIRNVRGVGYMIPRRG